MAPNSTTQLSISDLLPFLDCEYKGYTRFYSQRWTAPSPEQITGTYFHELAAALAISTSKHTAAVTIPAPPEVVKGNPFYTDIFQELVQFLAKPPFEIISVETPLKFEVAPGIELLTRVDGLVASSSPNSNVLISDLQYKTLGKGKSVGDELQRVFRSPHQISYRHGWRTHGGVNISGTELVIIRTFMSQENSRLKVPHVQRYSLPATAEEDAAAWEDIVIYIKRLARGKHKARNWSACQGRFGRCPLFTHCHFGTDIEHCLPVPLEKRYRDITDDAGTAAAGEGQDSPVAGPTHQPTLPL